ncbi:MAG: HPr family phosphocarrier protein [Gammaproteobacteria bacterium]|nr:HPr family phosphocarrier protein [Gammaproteobacteria bacterium]MBU1656148.1 HPr family phosphocarrier protein [Gammaproteobacteria bacterium]MBU1960792.1 HPr family phosphocarrier protein [Gammaproteobacteria bacterium]
MTSAEIKIINKLGLHARAAARFATLARNFASDIQIDKGGRRVNGKSIMGIMMLAAGQGTTLTLHAEGEDEEGALSQLQGLIANRFGEAE